MIIDLNSIIQLMTIVGALSAPTLTSIWARNGAARDAKHAAEKVSEVKETLVKSSVETKVQLGEIHSLVNDQLTQAVNRFEVATRRIVDLEAKVKKLEGGG